MSTETALPIAEPVAFVIEQKDAARSAERVVFYGVICLLIFGPLAFGGGEPWSRFVFEMGSCGLLLTWIIAQVRSGDLLIADNALFSPMLLFGALAVFQTISGATASRARTISGALEYVAYGALCFLTIQMLRRNSQVKAFAWMLSIFGTAIGVLAVAQQLTKTDKLYWMWKPEFGGWIFGPYVNHNHYAGLMEMLVPLPLVFSMTKQSGGIQKWLAAAAAAFMACTIFLSGSRGGMTALVAQMAFLVMIISVNRAGRKKAAPFAVFLAALLALVAWLGIGQVADRLVSIHSEARTELSGGIRVAIDRDGIRMFRQKPITGFGLGIFPDVYPRFRSFSTTLSVNRAHNDYVQLLVEGGAVGFGLMIWWVILMYRHGLAKITAWEWDVNGAMKLAALTGCTGILVHSFVDSNLQIPANAALFYVLASVAARPAKSKDSLPANLR